MKPTIFNRERSSYDKAVLAFAACAVCWSLITGIVFMLPRKRELPPRELAPNAYHTIRLDRTVCAGCHQEIR
ncbi:MAG: hypothetical protein PHN75_21255 [Syntrophales bacterium]|nr:hypothetical protein [Syntrophales bacterium]